MTSPTSSAICPEDQRAQLMALLDRDSKDEVESLLKYDPNSAGGIMTTDFFSLPHTLTVEEAIENIRSREDVEMVFYLYLTDEAGRWWASSPCGSCCSHGPVHGSTRS
jgi:magnesium transporter